MQADKRQILDEALGARRSRVQDYVRARAAAYAGCLAEGHLRDAVMSFVEHGGKGLRAQVLLLSCGLVGGNEELAVPAAAAVEAFHGWTLIHDDIIDRDLRRRGRPTIHEEYRRQAERQWGLSDPEARHYGHCLAILAGDVLQGWAVSLLCELNRKPGVSPEVVTYLIEDLNLRIRSGLMDGEMADVELPQLSLDALQPDAIIRMMHQKTGYLYEFAGRAGAMVGLNNADPSSPAAEALSSFAGRCGIAFQLQDDVLAVVGNERVLGKSTGSDITLGKRTVVNTYALEQAGEAQRRRLLRVFGNRQAAPAEVEEAKSLLKELGGVEYARNLAAAYLKEALGFLDAFPPSQPKELLVLLAEYMIDRQS
jgi:geranylgeranyl diphosphate synthase, type I